MAPLLIQIPPAATPDQDPVTMEGSFSCKDDDGNSSSSGVSGGGGHFLGEQEEAASVPPEHAPGAPPAPPFLPAGPTPDTKLSPTSAASTRTTGTPSSPSPKRSGRRSVQKRVVSIPIADAEGSRAKGCSEGAPPSDSWAWRKYGQKPIKGSPYPRGYYRCSSSKGCPARKQVERSRDDPSMLVVTYACEHNHPGPLPKNNHHHHNQQQPSPAAARSSQKPSPPERDPDPPALPAPPLSSSPASADLDDSSFAADLLGEEHSLGMMPDEFGWFSDVSASPPPAEAFLGSLMMPTVLMEDDVELGGGDGAGDEESSLFAGLGELPEYAVVFRRVRMQMAAREDPRSVAAAPCCGSTG